MISNDISSLRDFSTGKLPDDEFYMRRAIRLARCGDARTTTNPRVGAVITARGRIIGEGFHRRCGEPHAEVNAIRAVAEADLHLLPEATIYVTLEPCSHYGKTPPCAKLLIEKRIPRVVVGSADPFPQVSGRGIKMLRDAGAEVLVGVLEKECLDLNIRFMTAHKLGRPFVQLKWAQSADFFIAPEPGEPRAVFSSPLSMAFMHAERAMAGAIMVGVNTIITDNPTLTCRLWPGADPLKVSRLSARIPAESNFATSPHILQQPGESIPDFLRRLYLEHRVHALMVEGGRQTLQDFIDADIFDELRIEISPTLLHRGIKAPYFNPENLTLIDKFIIRDNILMIFRR